MEGDEFGEICAVLNNPKRQSTPLQNNASGRVNVRSLDEVGSPAV
jgi:hypothetical protein